jgi:hypothetical protein
MRYTVDIWPIPVALSHRAFGLWTYSMPVVVVGLLCVTNVHGTGVIGDF